jgi:hypothetical protein
MERTAARRGMAWGLISGSVAGALFGLFVNALDTDFGRAAGRGAAAAAKDNKDPHFPIPADPKGAAAFTVGLVLALLVAWGIRRSARASHTVGPVLPPKGGLAAAVADHLVLAFFLALLATVCGVLSLAQVGAGSPGQFVVIASAVGALLAGAYGALFGWMENRRGRRSAV